MMANGTKKSPTSVDGKLDLIITKVTDLDNKLDNHEARIASLESKIGNENSGMIHDLIFLRGLFGKGGLL